MEKIINSSNILNYTVSEKDIISLPDYRRILENITDENNLLELLELPNGINKIFKYVKYYCNPIYYLHNITITEHQNNIKHLLQDLKEIDINHINFYCWLYNISYLDCNKKDFLLQYYNIISAKLPIIPFKNKKKTKNNKIKLGIVGFTINREDSDTFSLHSVYRDRAEILKKMDSTLFEKYFIIKEEHSKEYITKSGNLGILLQEFYNKMDHIISIHNYDINCIKSLIDLDLDILLYPDIGMNPFTNTMGNYRIAPIQINTWGHSVTSGLVNMDYYISSKYYEVDDLTKAQEYYSEKLIAMDSLSTYYRCYNLTDPYSREQLNIPNNRQILFCIQNMRKLNLDFFNLLKTIIELKPNIIILLRKHFLKKNNIDDIYKLTNGTNNILFIDDCSTHLYHCYIYHSTLVLDTYPFGGCNSSLEGFSLGKIVITRPAEYLAGRFTYGFYKKMNIMDAIVDNYQDYIDKVIYYLDNTTARKELEHRILENTHLLFNDEDSVKEWEQTLIELSKPYVELIEEPEYKYTSDWLPRSINNFENNLLPLKDNINKILEIGSYDGRSSVWFLNNIMNNENSRLYCIDPFFATSNYKDNFLHNINISHNNTKINIIENTSLLGLSQLIVTKKQFNIIYINGTHYSRDVNQELVISWHLLTINGLLIFDDYLFSGFKENIDSKLLPKDTMEHFLSTISNQYEVIHKDYQLLIKKIYHKTHNDFLNNIGLKKHSLVEKLKYNNIELLQSLIPKNKPIAHCYYEESFNFGDSAIWYGQQHLLELLNIKPVYTCNDRNYDKLEIQTQLNNDGVILFRGGGNFGDLYVYHNLRLQIMQDNPNSIFIQLPQSVKFNNVENVTKTANIIKKIKKVILLARDIDTYQYFLQHFYFDNVEIYLCSDMAFNLGNINVKTKPIFKELILKRTDKETEYKIEDIIKDKLGNNVNAISYKYNYQNTTLLETTIYTDKQKQIGITDWYLTKSLNDELYNTLDYNTKAKIGLEMAYNILSLGERVITDRLHGFILSLQLNKPHTIINNNNGKLFSFYNTWCKNSTITKLKENFNIISNTNVSIYLKDKLMTNDSTNIIHILKPIIDQNSIMYQYLYNNKMYSFTNNFLSNEIIYDGIEGIISVFVPHCILTGKTIYSEIPVDKTYINNLQKLVPVFRKWHHNNNLELNIDVPIKTNFKNKQKKILSTFTMGVDSFYTLYSNIDKLDAILFVIGFDIFLSQKHLLNKTIENLKKVAKIYNKELILCETDLRIKLNHGLGFNTGDGWGEYLHGPAIFNISYSLDNYSELIVPSSHISRDYVWGSTFECDKFYSSYKLNITHDGYLPRNDKVDYIISYDVKSLDFLRVCWQNPNQSYNCSNCEKCYRTIYPIYINGLFDKAYTFGNRIPEIKYKNNKSSQNSVMEHYRYSLRYVKKEKDMINLGYIDNPLNMVKEINKLNSQFFDKKPVPGQTSTELYNNTFGWCGIPLINDSGIGGSEGLRFAGSNAVNGDSFVYTEILKNSEYFINLIKKIEDNFDTRCGLTRILQLNKGGYIAPHKDGDIFNKRIFRCHIPVVTKYPEVFMDINNESYHMSEGNIYLTDTSQTHSVTNNSDIDRIHIVIDLLFSRKLMEYINNGLPTKLIPLYEFNNKSKELIICFSGLGINDIPHFLFQKTLKKLNQNILFIRDIERSWYINGIAGITYDIDTNVNYLQNYIKNYNKVTFIGVSGGGFAALYYGNLLNIDKIIAFSPQTFLDLETKELLNDNRWCKEDFYKYITSYDKTILNLKNISFSTNTKMYIHYGYNNSNTIDETHAYYIKNKSNNIEYYKYYVVNNPDRLTLYLKENNKLDDIITASFY